MRDLVFIAFLFALFGLALRRPFIFVLGYVYIDNVAPQRLSYFLLNTVPISQIFAILAILAWLFVDDKRDSRFAPRQALLVLLLIYCGVTTTQADFPIEAFEKWDWVWKALAFAIFLPLTLRTRLRIEALALFMVLSAASIIIVGGIKTMLSGGGYGSLNLMVTNNTGLYESSIISCVAIALIPVILFLTKHSLIFPPEWRVKYFGYALIFACLLMPIGTEARTGLICIGVLAVIALRFTERRVLYASLMAVAALAAIPFLPQSFTERMGSIKEYKGDSSASTRIEVWKWTLDFVKDHPFGGGFDAFRGNAIRYNTVVKEQVGTHTEYKKVLIVDRARAYHSSYFEMLGEQGWPGLIIWLIIHFGGVYRMEMLFRQYRERPPDNGQWIASLANALQQAHIVYLVGALFVGIAFQPFVYMLVGLQIGLDTYAARRAKEATWRPIGNMKPAAA